MTQTYFIYGLAVFSIIVLIYYRKTKRYKERPVDNVWAFLDHNMVEIPLLFTIAPNAATSVVELIKTLVK